MSKNELVLTTIDGEARVLDWDLAVELEYATGRERDIRKLIKRHEGALREMGKLRAVVARSSGGRRPEEYRLNKAQALYIITKAETAKAVEVTISVIEKFLSYEQGLVQRPYPAIPQTFVEALRLSADQTERAELAEALGAVLAAEIEGLEPLAAVGRGRTRTCQHTIL